VPAANVPCGHCIFCLNDYPYYFCENLQDYGNSLHAGIAPHLFGGWSEFMYLLPGTPLFRVPDGLPDEVAALTEVMAVTHGFDRARMLNAGWGGGTFGDMGPLAINPNADICTKNVSVIGVGGETATSYLPAMTLMARNLDRLPLTEMITHRMPLERATEAVELSQRDGTMKVLMDP